LFHCFELVLHAGVDEFVFHLQHQAADDRIVDLLRDDGVFAEGAADFLCSPDLLKEFLDKLGVQEGSSIPPFEALLRVQERGGTPISPQLIIVYKRQHETASVPADHS